MIGLSEFQRMWQDMVARKDGYMLFYIEEIKRQYGVGFWIGKNMRNIVIEIRGISERIALKNSLKKENI